MILLCAAAQAEALKWFDPQTGYRIGQYRSPTPESVPGGTRITLEQLDNLVANKSAVLVDVMAAEGAGTDPQTGQWLLSVKHEHIPGSTWLPDVGKGKITPQLDQYYQNNLEKLTKGNKAAPLIIYCLADCWMSWNAVQRAAGYGYTAIYWYPEGVDGWREWNDRKLVPAKPIPLEPAPHASRP